MTPLGAAAGAPKENAAGCGIDGAPNPKPAEGATAAGCPKLKLVDAGVGAAGCPKLKLVDAGTAVAGCCPNPLNIIFLL